MKRGQEDKKTTQTSRLLDRIGPVAQWPSGPVAQGPSGPIRWKYFRYWWVVREYFPSDKYYYYSYSQVLEFTNYSYSYLYRSWLRESIPIPIRGKKTICWSLLLMNGLRYNFLYTPLYILVHYTVHYNVHFKEHRYQSVSLFLQEQYPTSLLDNIQYSV